MKFEIDPNELTTDQRAHVAAFITGWPVNNQLKALATSVRFEEEPAEEQRLDAEQKRDMDTTGELREISGSEEARELGAAAADNLNAIFGTPTATERLELGAKIDSLVPLDKEGLPWDSRIHASTKTFIADGSWKLRRGVDPAEVEKVKAQLKELMAVPQALVTDYHTGASSVPVPQATIVPAPVFTPTSVGYVPQVTAGVDTASGSDVTVIIPTPPPPKSHYLIDQQQPATVTLTDLIARMSSAIVAGKITQATVTEMCAKHGVSEFMLLSSRPDLIPLIDADMKAMGV